MSSRIINLLSELSRYMQQNGDVVWLIGVPWIPLTVVSGIRCVRFRDSEPDYNSEAVEIGSILPGGLEVLGALLVSDRGDAVEDSLKFSKNIRKALNTTSDHLVAATGSVGRESVKFYSQSLEVLESKAVTAKEFWETTSVIHSRVQLDLAFYTPSRSSSEYEKQVAAKMKDVLEGFKGSEMVCVLEGHLKKMVVQSQNDELVDVFPKRPSDSSGVPHPIGMKVLWRHSCSLEKVSSPVVQYCPSTEGTLLHTVTVRLDVLCLVPDKYGLAKTKNAVIRALSVQLESMGRSLSKNNHVDKKLQPFHFMAPGVVHPVTAIYDVSRSELSSESVETRKTLHSRLGLPLDRPLLRVANALTIRGSEILANKPDVGKRLLDVHVGLPRCGISGGEVNIIDGSYEYYHYLQDRLDDKGWGCAYRSLQTIISWFRLQHYTSVAVPSHRDIQSALVEIGDKEPSFVGSQDWIGAIELSFVLDKLLGVTSKILNVRSGAELPEKCRELAAHFNSQGTPVMIGGGVLAYTLLGVDYNELTGESAFLILDPHYTGGEDLKSIRSGGWCGWKRAVSESGKEFFLRNKFYNLLLPQRPQTV